METEEAARRKELLVGAMIVMLVACVLINMVATIVRNQQYLPQLITDPTLGTIINIVATLYAVGIVAFGVWMIAKPHARLEELNRRFSIKGVLPGYFLLALFPVAMGSMVIVLTQQTTWGAWLACSSVPAIVLFLVVALRKNNSSR